MPKATRFAVPLAALLLGCTALSANAGWFDSAKPETAAKDSKDAKALAAAAQPSTNLEDSVHQAQMLRLAGSYPEAIKHLSQLMMVASDDPRVVSEYGKTLAAMGRAQDAVNFLNRAQQLQPNDWTVYSALGVAYDQLGNQKDAQGAYEHALTLKPGEPSVLSNYALSRMLAKDPDMAKKLAARAEIAGGASDPKIASNIAMIRSMTLEAPDASVAVNHPAPSPVPRVVAAAPQAPHQSVPLVNPPAPMASNAAPRPMPSMVNNSVIDLPPQMAQAQMQMQAPRDNRVVMQRVPVDPLAGPVGPAIAATHAPRPLQFKTERATAKNEPAAPKADAPKLSPVPGSGVTTAAAKADDLQARAEAIAKQLTNKPAAIAAAKAEANKGPVARVAIEKPAAAAQPGPATAPKVLPPTVKSAEVKPTPKPATPAPVQAAAKTPAAQKTAAAKPKDAIPGLRMSANAY
ncbi:MAG TPA: tetratricopeptide repeat protein [Rhizomicrobium sp.]|nr:tetratricopeptide repeat protein [Rhizomicrobium sp.]